jgi:hypothetical protein
MPVLPRLAADDNFGIRTGLRSAMFKKLLVAALLTFPFLGAIAAEGTGNKFNDELLSLPPEQQAKLLTKGIKGCQGEAPFSMGVTTSGKAKGYAYWSVRCKDGRSFAVQITPKSQAMAADCRALEGTGRECFKKF